MHGLAGLCAYLTRWSSPETLEAGAMSGAILETWVMTEVIKSYWHNGKQAPIYFYRDRDQKEIDLLIMRDDALYPVEVKKTAAPRKEDVRAFNTLSKLGKTIGPGAVICLTDMCYPITEQVSALPVRMIGFDGYG